MDTDPAISGLPTLAQARKQIQRYGLENEADPQAVLVAVRLLAAGSRLGQATETHFARFGLSTGRYRLLAHLEDCNGEQSPSQLAAALGITRATVSGLIDTLEKEKLVCRTRSGEDGRSVMVVLTARGAGRLREMVPEHFARLQTMVSGLTPDERKVFLGLLERITSGIDAVVTD